MGNICSPSTTPMSDYSDFCPLRIASLYADIDESINKKKKIETLVEYFMRSYHGYNLDVLCIQGIRNHKILKEIISAFKHRIETFNDENRMGYGKAIYLEYYPDIECNDKPNENDLYWSTSESEGDNNYCDKLIVSRHNILQSADVQIGTDKHVGTLDNLNDASLMLNNDSDEIANIYKYVQVVNLNVDGTFVSLYNVELEDDSIGISNNKERRKQIREIKNIVESNRKKSIDPEMRQFVHGDSTYIASNRDIHIVTGMFHINELKNGSVSSEYNKTVMTLNALDVHRWVAVLRKNTTPTDTNVRCTKDTFTFLFSKNLSMTQDITLKSQKLFEDHKMVVVNSNINKHLVDMNRFTNFPEDSIFMLYRPNIELFDNKRYMHKTNGSGNLQKIQNNPTRFMDEMEKTVLVEKYSKGKKPHPVFGAAADSNTAYASTASSDKNHVDFIIEHKSARTTKKLPQRRLNPAPIQSPSRIKNFLQKDANQNNTHTISTNLNDTINQHTDKHDDPTQSKSFVSIFTNRTNQITSTKINRNDYSKSSIDAKDEVELGEIIKRAKSFDPISYDITNNHDNQNDTSDQDSSDDDANKEIQDMVDLHVKKTIKNKNNRKGSSSMNLHEPLDSINPKTDGKDDNISAQNL